MNFAINQHWESLKAVAIRVLDGVYIARVLRVYKNFCMLRANSIVCYRQILWIMPMDRSTTSIVCEVQVKITEPTLLLSIVSYCVTYWMMCSPYFRSPLSLFSCPAWPITTSKSDRAPHHKCSLFFAIVQILYSVLFSSYQHTDLQLLQHQLEYWKISNEKRQSSYEIRTDSPSIGFADTDWTHIHIVVCVSKIAVSPHDLRRPINYRNNKKNII